MGVERSMWRATGVDGAGSPAATGDVQLGKRGSTRRIDIVAFDIVQPDTPSHGANKIKELR
jgi:hypothetical protein